MSSQIIFYNKSIVDIDFPSTSVTASEGQAYAYLPMNRNNRSAWQTTGSADANNTTYTVDFGQLRDIDTIVMIIHNFKAFTIKYWNGSSYVNFSTPIAETVNAAETNFYHFNTTTTSKIQLIITGCMVVDMDKFLYQFIVTTRIGQLTGWPVISGHNVSVNRTINQMLSGKASIYENVGYFSCNLSVEAWGIASDLAIIEELYGATEGFLMSLCGGDDSQFRSKRIGYRLQDLFLMKCTNEYSADYLNGLYKSGVFISVDLTEVTS